MNDSWVVWFWLFSGLTFFGLCKLGIHFDWDFWFLIAIGLQVLVWILMAILWGLGCEDGANFSFKYLFVVLVGLSFIGYVGFFLVGGHVFWLILLIVLFIFFH